MSTKINIDQVLSIIQDNFNAICCPIHQEDICMICVEAQNPENIFKLLCTECEEIHEKTNQKITFQKQFLKLLKSSVTDDTSQHNMNYEKKIGFETEKSKYEQSVKKLTEKVHFLLEKIKAKLEQQIQMIEIVKQRVLQLEKYQEIPLPQQVSDILSKLSEATHYEHFQKTLFELKIFQYNTQQAFPLISPSVANRQIEDLQNTIMHDFQIEIQSSLPLLKDVHDELLVFTQLKNSLNSLIDSSQMDINPAQFKIQQKTFDELKYVRSIFSLNEQTLALVGQDLKSDTAMVLVVEDINAELVCKDIINMKGGFSKSSCLGKFLGSVNENTMVCGVSERLILYDYLKLQIISEVVISEPGSVINSLVTDDDETVWVAQSNIYGGVSILKIKLNDCKHPKLELKGKNKYIIELLSFDQNFLLSSDGNTINVWNKNTGSIEKTFNFEYPIYTLSKEADLTHVLIAGGNNQIKYLQYSGSQWEIENQKLININDAGSDIRKALPVQTGFIIVSPSHGCKFYNSTQQKLTAFILEKTKYVNCNIPSLYQQNGNVMLVYAYQNDVYRMVKRKLYRTKKLIIFSQEQQ